MSGGAGHCQHKKKKPLFLYKLYKFFTLFFHNHSNIIKYIYCCALKKIVRTLLYTVKTYHCALYFFFLSYCKVYCKIIYLYSTVLSLSLCMYYIFFFALFFFLLYYVLQSLHIYNHKFYRSNTIYLDILF